MLGPDLYARLYPDWTASQAADVERACTGGAYTVWVAEADGAVAGFVAYQANAETKVGEVYMLAVDPAHQRRGLGTRLNAVALDRLQEAGMEVAQVGTGGDPGHAPARRTYEKAGYTAQPSVRYVTRRTYEKASYTPAVRLVLQAAAPRRASPSPCDRERSGLARHRAARDRPARSQAADKDMRTGASLECSIRRGLRIGGIVASRSWSHRSPKGWPPGSSRA